MFNSTDKSSEVSKIDTKKQNHIILPWPPTTTVIGCIIDGPGLFRLLARGYATTYQKTLCRRRHYQSSDVQSSFSSGSRDHDIVI